MGRAYYREYRPLNLDEVVGQDHITDTLKNAIKKGAISHAYLFTGPRGVGKTSIARILAHQINDLKYDENETHIDIIEIDAASNRRIDEIRDLREKVHIAPTSAKYKVYIIDEVHMLTREAFNALLKTLEEPPEHAVFILATTEAHKVPETIISRTQRFSFKPLQNDSMVNHLRMIADKEKLKVEDEALDLIADHGRGSFRDSISMLDQIASFGHDKITTVTVMELLGIPDNNLIKDIIHSVATNDVAELFENITKLKEQGVNPAKTAQRLISFLRVNINEKNVAISLNKSVKLMKDLLPLTGSYGTFQGLEIVLLDNIDIVENIETAPNPTPQVVAEKPVEEKVEEKTPEVSPKDPEPVVSESEPEQKVEISSDWKGVLEALKKENNTLYGLLRMADAEVKEGEIHLVFKFDFHDKQMRNQKNSSTLESVAKDVLGKKHKIITTVKKQKTAKQIINPAEKPKDNLKSVSNIFSGAELLES